jgi:hypothetical protein
MEFWNRSVTRGAYIDNEYAEIQTTFSKLPLTFDPATGIADISPTRYIAQSGRDSRFRMRGPQVSLTRDVLLIDAGKHWRTDWLTMGIDDDGFTIPGKQGTIRVYPFAGQRTPRLRYLTLVLEAPGAPMGGTFRSNDGTWKVDVPANGTQQIQVSVCVPPKGYADVTVDPHGEGQVWGDLSSKLNIGIDRERSIWLNRIALGDELGRCASAA